MSTSNRSGIQPKRNNTIYLYIRKQEERESRERKKQQCDTEVETKISQTILKSFNVCSLCLVKRCGVFTCTQCVRTLYMYAVLESRRLPTECCAKQNYGGIRNTLAFQLVCTNSSHKFNILSALCDLSFVWMLNDDDDKKKITTKQALCSKAINNNIQGFYAKQFFKIG